MNETLETMARALFKSWFVDFDPVRAKATLRNPRQITPPLEGESGRQGRQPAGEPVGGTRRRATPTPLAGHQNANTPPKPCTTPGPCVKIRQTWKGCCGTTCANKQLGGYKFRRQQPIGSYIADFACLPEKLLIELDGGQHAEPEHPRRTA